MTAAPSWLQVMALVVQIIVSVSAVIFTLFVLWPSIRRQNRTSDKLDQALDRAGQKGIDDLINKL